MFQTLYNILRQQRIEIPIIQRDYAQGRENKVYLRERLLGKMIKVLQDKSGKDTLNLDFVYGTNEHGAMWPLDGQQRLTTLWLLHWYLAVRTNNLASAKEWLSQFTYENRTTSRDFCKSLCNMDAEAFSQSGMKLVDFIKDQTWFYSQYKQDPTIQGMLRTLGGTNIMNSENVDIQDGIEEFLANDKNCSEYWERLLANDCPIHFLFKDMKDENLPLSDDLYLKMNARGKQLTDFENFKADLIGYAPNPDKPNDKLLDTTTAALIDNQWTDIFWKEACEKKVYIVDDIYFKFLRRYFLDRLIATSDFKAEELTKHPLYQNLYKGKKEYDGLNDYRDVLTKETVENLKDLFDRWNEYIVGPHWDETESFAFIPQYIIKESDENGLPKLVEVSTISQKERAVFHAIICYYEQNESFDKENFDAWKRFAWNIVENSSLQDENTMIGAIRLFEELRPHCGNILQFLASDAKVRSNYAGRQMEEERFKAKLLTGNNATQWKQCIHDAENFGFFKGCIGCLLRLDKKDYVNDVAVFTKKYAKAREYFDEKGVKDDYALPLIQALIRTAHRWEQLVNQYLYDSSAEGWKNNILNNNIGYFQEVHKLLMANRLGDLSFVFICDDTKEWIKSANEIKRVLGETDFLNQEIEKYGKIVRNGSNWRIVWTDGNFPWFYPYKQHQAFVFDWNYPVSGYSFRRNELLHHNNIIVDAYDYNRIFWGWKINFDYRGNSYRWDDRNYIYLLNRLGNPKRRSRKNKIGDEFFCVHMNELQEITQQGFLIRLTGLAKESET